MAQKLFEQDPPLEELGLNTRLAGGIEDQSGADNILVSAFLAQIGKYLIRSEGNVTVNPGSQDITFSSDFGTTDYSLQIFDINGIGIGVTAQASDKFTIESLGTGVLNYIAIINV